MKRRLARYAAVMVVMILASVGGAFLYKKWSLHQYHHFVEGFYQPELSLIENEMRAGKAVGPKAADLETFELGDRVRDKIGQALSRSEFFAASWTSDGHHGLESLKRLPMGYTYSRSIGSSDTGQSHALYFGEAEDGTELLIYVGWVQSDWKREYSIAFRKSEVDARRREMSNKPTPVNAPAASSFQVERPDRRVPE